jgi:hypothetical protein
VSPPHPTAPQQWSSHHQPTKFLVQRDAAWRDDQRKIAVTFPPNYGTAKLDLMNFAVGKLNQLLRLEHGWDGLGAAQIAETTAATAIQWLDLLAEDHTFPPQIFPLPTGGVQVEWLAGGESLEIEIGPQNTIGILGLDAAGNVLVEGDYPDPRGTSDRIATAPRSVSTASCPKWVWGPQDLVRAPQNAVVAVRTAVPRQVSLGVLRDPWPTGTDDDDHPRSAADALIVGFRGLGHRSRGGWRLCVVPPRSSGQHGSGENQVERLDVIVSTMNLLVPVTHALPIGGGQARLSERIERRYAWFD